MEDWQKTGCNYAMYVPETKQVNPPGEWNSSMVLYKDGYVEHWLNGEKLFSFKKGPKIGRCVVIAVNGKLSPITVSLPPVNFVFRTMEVKYISRM